MDKRQQRGGRNHTIHERDWFNCSANPPVKQIHNFFLLLLHYPPSEELFPNTHLEYGFQTNKGIFPQWVLKCDHHPFYRKGIAYIQAYISKYNSFSFPSLVSFVEPPVCAVHLQTCKRDCFPPALHCPAPLSTARSNYQPCLTHKASVMMTRREIRLLSSNLRMLLTCLSWSSTTPTYHTACLHLVTWLLFPPEPPPHTPLLYTSSWWHLIVFAGYQDSHQALLTSKMLGHISSPSHALTSYSIKERSWTDLPHPSPLCCSQTALELFCGSGLRFSDPSFSASHWRSGVGFALPSHHIPQGTLSAITRGSELDKTSTLE